MAQTFKQLGQARENSTNAVSVYSPPASTETIIKTIILTNVSATDATFRLFMDDDGTTYDESTAIAYDVSLGVGEVIEFNGSYNMATDAGNFAYRSSVANAITITLFGVETS